jgi:hypothetical protein
MRRVIALFLIPMCLFGQGMPHSHAGTGVCEPEGHAARPHVHFDHHDAVAAHGHHHADAADRDHHHAPVTSEKSKSHAFAPVADHDADAFYFTTLNSSLARRLTANNNRHSRMFEHTAAQCWGMVLTLSGRGETSGVAPPGGVADLPILLRTASLRI